MPISRRCFCAAVLSLGTGGVLPGSALASSREEFMVNTPWVTADGKIKIVGEQVENMSAFYLPAFPSVQSIREHILGQRLNFRGALTLVSR